jgi:hypothetical protein
MPINSKGKLGAEKGEEDKSDNLEYKTSKHEIVAQLQLRTPFR